MAKHITIFSFILCFLVLISPVISGGQDWKFTLLNIVTNTTDAEVVDFSGMRPMRDKSNNYAVHGSFILGVDLDNSYQVEIKIYRSASGSSQYRILPYAIPKTSFNNFMNVVYVKMLQKDLASCSNMPQVGANWKIPLEKGTYTFDMCAISTEGMPGHLQPGYYRITAHLKNTNFDLFVSIFARSESQV